MSKIAAFILLIFTINAQTIYSYSPGDPSSTSEPSIEFVYNSQDNPINSNEIVTVYIRSFGRDYGQGIRGSYGGSFWAYFDLSPLNSCVVYTNQLLYNYCLYSDFTDLFWLSPTNTPAGVYTYNGCTLAGFPPCPTPWTEVYDYSTPAYNSHVVIFTGNPFVAITLPIASMELPPGIVSYLFGFPLIVIGNMQHDFDGSGSFLMNATLIE